MTVGEIERWMWADACELLARAERLHRQFFMPFVVEGAIGWSPPVDLYETESEFIALIALPGVAPSDVEIGLFGRTLEVRGHRRMPGLVRGAVIHRLEIPQGRFLLQFSLPEGGVTLAAQGFEHGCLLLRLAKSVQGAKR
ncbi:MAG TPA: Hsp20/alpha crystallin family protein [Xanthobacteraceae bacterium]|nr:Hsp20/alpha crystallin family protein [Xanthobacteraceae bacterium]